MSILDSAREAGPALAASDADSARLGYLSDEAWAQLQRIGVLRALQPKRWGGGEVPFAEYLATIVEIGRHSPAAGWVASVVGVHPWQIALFDERAQAELWGDDPALVIASSYTPTGKVEAVEGGFAVSGRWSFSSGSHHADAIILGGIAGTREFDGREYGDFTSVVVAKGDYTIDQTWNTAGLRGTGSNDVVVDNVFVPAYRAQSHLDYTHGLGTPLPGQAVNDGPLYRLPWAVVFGAIISAAAVGAAKGFLDRWTAETRNRRTNYGGVLRDEPVVQNHLAKAAWAVDAAELKLRRAATELTAAAEAGAVPGKEERAFYRWDVAHAAQVAVDEIVSLMRTASGRAAYVDHPLHRAYQDVMAAIGHAFLVEEPLGNAFAGRRLGSGNLPEVHL
ncbi:acyl-CoA dehydrogenase family protein [Actinoallomurus sp. CA-142502]|uniref:acyl-CoA dehydrogenase family protein n=1 Tax=Actinoallomurus sp. CA-142502 TaxID=3239885 RepID=UPI003D90D8CC